MEKEVKEIGKKNKIEKELVIKVSKMKPVIKPTIPHRHEGYHELIFLSKGSGYHVVDDIKHEVRPPVGFYLNLGQVHCWDFSKIPEGFVVMFKEEALANYPSALDNLFRLHNKFNLPRQEFNLMDQLNLFYRDFKANEPLELLSAHLNTLILKTLYLPAVKDQVHPSFVSEFSRLKKLLNENFLKLRTVEEYANLMKISSRKLNQICQAAAGCNAIEIIKEKLLIESKNLLTHTNLPVTEVAYQLNFSDASNFIKFFKSQTTLTPLEYRSRLLA
ncbi:helix-turn-helix domain-containing protein [Cyclobacterium marinum]|uniref:Transcriptional regulator, AraC family n=1 Tax=Cyclobacterium marinum (strain ATCC 25205 / DSM 745 / LMG 13164 / NCIMB 1802) TaxID=880070 RepID=G0J5H8_CYCMS|nr:AraC family transcriptional regulator [Cyclobacterium marinum]AEL28427.1 transcriptional regulator, AraC family [Cyclobacterium marinum DSM 745]MBR9776971.1 helix-turn-helix transcriptional regulator [Cytophagales bacterium]|tara:strand:- start:256136 stop:256957 length:822 start_codon:yes stop_codon:yes gene_type:complete